MPSAASRASDVPPRFADPGARPLSSFARLASWIATAKLAAFAVNVALPLILVRRLAQVDFGFYEQAFLIDRSAVSCLPLKFSMSALYFLAREAEQGWKFACHVAVFHSVAFAGVVRRCAG